MAAVDHGRELTLEVPSTHLPFYSSITLSTSTLDLNSTAAFSPRTLYAQSFDHPYSSPNLPSSSYARKNVKTMTGYTTTEDEFNALPMAVRRKVREASNISSQTRTHRFQHEYRRFIYSSHQFAGKREDWHFFLQLEKLNWEVQMSLDVYPMECNHRPICEGFHPSGQSRATSPA